MKPHIILGKQAYVKGTNVRVKVTAFDSDKRSTKCDVKFLDVPDDLCYKKAIYLHGTCSSYSTKEEELSGRFNLRDLSTTPFGTAASKVFYSEENE